ESRVCSESGPDTDSARPLVVPLLLANVIEIVTVLDERLGVPWDEPLRFPCPEQAANDGAAAATVMAGTAQAAVTPVRTSERRATWARSSEGVRCRGIDTPEGGRLEGGCSPSSRPTVANASAGCSHNRQVCSVLLLGRTYGSRLAYCTC